MSCDPSAKLFDDKNHGFGRMKACNLVCFEESAWLHYILNQRFSRNILGRSDILRFFSFDTIDRLRSQASYEIRIRAFRMENGSEYIVRLLCILCHAIALPRSRAEIGRASCREREGKDGLISVAHVP